MTMAREDVIEEIGFLGSATRIRLLSALGASEPVEKDELRDRFDVSRTTLKRNLDDLCDRGWVCEEGSSEYRLTASGRMAEERLDELVGLSIPRWSSVRSWSGSTRKRSTSIRRRSRTLTSRSRNRRTPTRR